MSPLFKIQELNTPPASTRLSAKGLKFIQVDGGIYVDAEQHAALIAAYTANPNERYEIPQRIKAGSLDAGTIQLVDNTLFLRNRSAHYSPDKSETRLTARGNFAGLIATAVGATELSVQTLENLQNIFEIDQLVNWPEARIVLPK